jgi:hypothetical protein
VGSHVAEEVEALEEASTMVVVAEVIHQTRQGIVFLHISYVAGPTTLSSSAISALIQHTWVKTRQQTRHNRMEWIPIGMPTPEQQTM